MKEEFLVSIIIVLVVGYMYEKQKIDQHRMSLIHPQSLLHKLNLSSGSLYLSDWSAATDESLLISKNIKTVICLNERQKTKEEILIYHRNGIKYYHFTILDHPKAPINLLFNKCFTILQNGLQEGNVLVHCTAGISRS